MVFTKLFNNPPSALSAQVKEEKKMEVIKPRKLVHSGKKRAYPSSFVWDCTNCNSWNIWQTRRIFGNVNVVCQECKTHFILDKSNPKEEITRTKNMNSII